MRGEGEQGGSGVGGGGGVGGDEMERRGRGQEKGCPERRETDG